LVRPNAGTEIIDNKSSHGNPVQDFLPIAAVNSPQQLEIFQKLVEDILEKIRIESERKAKPQLKMEGEPVSFSTAVSKFEKALILSAMEKTNGIKDFAAQLLRMEKNTLEKKIKFYNLHFENT
jgi:DNA-binding NtrC family response regulator